MQMPEKDKKLLEEIEVLADRYFAFDEPVPFCGLFLYPVKTRYYNEFLACSSCLTLNKNDDPFGIKHTHLSYLISKMKDEKEGPFWSFKFSKMLELVFHISNGMHCDKCGKTMSYDDFFKRIEILKPQIKTDEDAKRVVLCDQEGCDGTLSESVKYKQDEETKRFFLLINGHKITDDDFFKLRKIIMYQNLPDFKDDSWVEKSIRDDQAEKNKLASKDSGTASLERKMLCLSAKSNYKIDEISNMSMRKFIMLLGIIQDAMDYEIQRTGLMSGMVSLKKGQKIEHWIYKVDEGLYGKAMDSADLVKKINS